VLTSIGSTHKVSTASRNTSGSDMLYLQYQQWDYALKRPPHMQHDMFYLQYQQWHYALKWSLHIQHDMFHMQYQQWEYALKWSLHTQPEIDDG